jgi:monoamine oxidase
MSAAHELIERGFEVVVLERRNIAGGKARSIPVSDDGAGTSGHMLADSGVAFIEHHLPVSTDSASSRDSTSTSSTPCAAYHRSMGARWRITSYRRRASASRSTESPRLSYRRSSRVPRRRWHGAA